MSKKLLLADDSVTIQKVIQITFANEDYDLTIVGNGDEALEKAKHNPPDLILADIIMPGKNGYELCSEIKNIPELAQAPVLLLVGSFEPFDEEKARKAGADSWIAKPFESQALIAKVQELLDNPPKPAAPPAAPPAPSLEEKEAQPEKIIPFDISTPAEKELSAEEASAEVPPLEEGMSTGDSFTFAEEEVVSEPAEPKEPAAAKCVESEEPFVPFASEEKTPSPPRAEEIAGFEFEEPASSEFSAESEAEFISFEAEPASPGQPPVEEPADLGTPEPASSEQVEKEEEKDFIFETETEETIMPAAQESPAVPGAAESGQNSVVFGGVPLTPPPVSVEEPDTFEFEEPVAPSSSAATEEKSVDSEAAAAPGAGEADEFDFEEPAAEEDEDDEDILLLDEDDILVEDETPEEDIFSAETDTDIEPADEQTEDFFDNLPASSFELEPEEEEESGIVLHRPLGAFSLDEDGDGSDGMEEEPSVATANEIGAREEEDSDQEFSFADLDDGLPEEEEAFIETEETSSQESKPAAEPEEKLQAPTYAQMEQKVHSLTDAQLYAIVEKVAGATIERMAKEVLEQVAWEVVPNLSENIIKEEIQKIKAAR